MPHLLLLLALLVAAAFTGATIYAKLVNHPARKTLSPEAA